MKLLSTFLLLVFVLCGCTVERVGDEAEGTDTTAASVDTTTRAAGDSTSRAAAGDTADVPDASGERASAATESGHAESAETSRQIDRVLVPAPVGPPSRGSRQLLPVDEADEAPDFFAYRHRLIEAVAARDADALLAAMSDDVHLSFGGDRGRTAFRRMWSPSDPGSEVWRILGRVLGGGGLYEEGPFELGDGTASARFTAPYTFAAFPDRYDAYQHGAITDEDIPVRTEPSESAGVVDTLSFAVVRIPQPPSPEERWTRIELSGGRTGYIPSASIAAPLDYRALFHRIDGEWVMTAFVAGD